MQNAEIERGWKYWSMMYRVVPVAGSVSSAATIVTAAQRPA